MAWKNSIDNISDPLSSTAITVCGPATAIDPSSHIQFDINAAHEFKVGTEYSPIGDDKFKISQGNIFSINDTFIMTQSGCVTKPLNPAFFGYLPSLDNNVTGAGSTYILGTVTPLVIPFDQGTNFDVSGLFRAPATGRYLLICVFKTEGITAAMTSGYITITTTNRTYYGNRFNPATVMDGSGRCGFQMKVIADMNINDTATAEIIISNGVADTADVAGSANGETYFCGALIA